MRSSSLDLSPREAIALQQQARHRVQLTPLPKPATTIGGCDVSMNRFAAHGFAGFITLDAHSLEPVAESVVEDRIPFPYIPGLLSFREIPMLMKAWERLSVRPELVVVDGIGIAHPRRFGIASHLGVLLEVPTIGCAKNVLIGRYEDPGPEPGSHTALIDPKTGETIGAALRTKRGTRPVFVSPGHRITLPEAIDLVFSTVRRHRIPEPTRLAHNLVNAYRIRATAE